MIILIAQHNDKRRHRKLIKQIYKDCTFLCKISRYDLLDNSFGTSLDSNKYVNLSFNVFSFINVFCMSYHTFGYKKSDPYRQYTDKLEKHLETLENYEQLKMVIEEFKVTAARSKELNANIFNDDTQPLIEEVREFNKLIVPEEYSRLVSGFNYLYFMLGNKDFNRFLFNSIMNVLNSRKAAVRVLSKNLFYEVMAGIYGDKQTIVNFYRPYMNFIGYDLKINSKNKVECYFIDPDDEAFKYLCKKQGLRNIKDNVWIGSMKPNEKEIYIRYTEKYSKLVDFMNK